MDQVCDASVLFYSTATGHQLIAFRLSQAFGVYLESHSIGTGLAAPCDVILSETDRELKRKRYEHFRVREYWLVDPDANSIEILGLEADRFVPPQSCHAACVLHVTAVSRSQNQSRLALEIVRSPSFHRTRQRLRNPFTMSSKLVGSFWETRR